MFLKRIEMQGFKSFADKTVIAFDDPITAVVGPNGCGKSNISDAVRWVLGEQSARSLRGEKMNDVIFSGSADRRMMNIAQVTLVFDNSEHLLNSESDELEITRRLYRDSSEAEYLINRKNVRLRDIVNIFMDTGLGKDSLSIISQGNVISFAEAKAKDRRGVFEEAAGVAKYKKRKMESLSRLSRTKDNLDRSTDILNELEKQVTPLKRAALKAEVYREKKARLEQIEITVLVKEIERLNDSIEEAKRTLFDIGTKSQMYSASIQIAENRIAEAKDRSARLDREVSTLQDQLMQCLNTVTALETRRAEMEERRKYIIEIGTREQKIEETRDLLNEAKAEYDDRKDRFDRLNTEIGLNATNMTAAAQAIFDASNEYENAQGILRGMESQRAYLENVMRDPFSTTRQAGTKSIMDHRHALHGILGVVGQVFAAHDGYELAVSEAIGGAVYNILTQDDQDARDAIRFLTRNQSGRATFLPLTVCTPRYVPHDIRVICENTPGYLGVASEFVDYEPQFRPAAENLLNNILVTDTLENGTKLSELIHRSLKIVTLTGEVIHRGGSMTGGKAKHSTTIVTVEKDLQEIRRSIDAQKARVALAEKKLNDARETRERLSRTYQQNRIEAASLEPIVEAKKAKYEKLKNDLALLMPEGDAPVPEEAAQADSSVIELNKAYSRRDEITAEIRSKREERTSVMQDIDRKEAQLRQTRKDLETATAAENAIRIDQGKLETQMDMNLQRLASEYRLTYEFARTKTEDADIDEAKEEVQQLRADIQRLGNVNMNAPEEYAEVNERYEFYKAQIAELSASRDKLLAAIDDMDKVMTKQFRSMFDRINTEFNRIFVSLYGGGKARLVLEDPGDILNTGIDVEAQPPGKNVQNNLLFSGGEKSLIALCVLFAILKVKPVPLVILDEVEAALDPSNVERFAQYLKHYTDRTQFIVVTHRSGTMQNADVLYGVTMQQQGVSQMLKVKLRDALKYDMSESGETQ